MMVNTSNRSIKYFSKPNENTKRFTDHSVRHNSLITFHVNTNYNIFKAVGFSNR